MPDTLSKAHKNLHDEIITDVAIIGAGPVGLFTVFECGMVGLSCHVIDALDEVGGQCTALYPETPIYDIPGHPVLQASDLILKLEEQAASFGPVYHLGQTVVSLSDNDSFKELRTSKGTIIKARAVVIAGGSGAFGPNKPPLEHIEEYEGRSIFYTVRKKNDFISKDIVIAGGGDSAVDWAIALAAVAKSVCLIHRRDKFRAAPASVKNLEQLVSKGLVELLTPYQLHGLNGRDGYLEAVELKSKQGEIRTIKADVLLPFYGLSMDLGPINDWGLGIKHNHIAIEPTTARTNITGIYAVGDIAAYNNKKKLILTGFSEAAFAAYDIYELLYPNEPLHFEYSTTKGLSGEFGG